MRVTWWRRNWWGLLVLPVVMVAALYPGLRGLYDQYWKAGARQPLNSSAGGWVSYAGARMRLVELKPATGLTNDSREPVRLPAGIQAWHARLDFAATGQGETALGACQLLAEAADGRTYRADTAELYGVAIGVPGCTNDATGASAGPRYQTDAYFALPSSARAAAVRVVIPDRLPVFARLLPA